MPDVYAVHHGLNEDHAYGAAILVRKVLMARTVACMSSNEGIGIQLSSMSKNPVNLFSVYCRPSHKNLGSIIDPMAKFQDLKHTLISMDSNAKNKLWGSKITDKKGKELEDFILHQNLNIFNTPKENLHYIPRNTAMVDVTIGGDKVKVENWKYLMVESLSDHPYIQFQLVLENNLAKAPSRKRVPKLTNLDKNIFKERLKNEVTKLKNNVNWSAVVTSRDLDHIITDITHIIAESAVQSLLPQKEKKRSNLDFWTPELTTLRTQMRKDKNIRDNLRKACENRGNNGKRPHSEMSIEETNYIKSKAKYQKHLRFSKDKSFKTFCSTNMNKDLFNSLKTL